MSHSIASKIKDSTLRLKTSDYITEPMHCKLECLKYLKSNLKDIKLEDTILKII